ncbi:hemerythrin domain-containing protein [Ectobacillus panaciterrae]|uniref:hemerythrin domain-containing protein n=1 Tax=Ectobacillus panaciterrae TaxID=363872 RepID=UPI000423056F|nr:hemerythrin domain-containing protein [Ectobacillus panaciterrae]
MGKGCHLSQSAEIMLCPALQKLKDEHIHLNTLKLALFQNSSAIQEEPKNAFLKIAELRKQVLAFLYVLELHSKKEEDVLFEMMANYIGKEMGPIAVMEYEHEQAKLNIAAFLEKTDNPSLALTEESTVRLVQFIINACTILTDHFMKEERVLFPMAEQMLSLEEKEEVYKRVEAM